MSSMIKASKKAGNGKPRHNPIRALHDREWKRKQKERSASIASSSARSPTPQPVPLGRPQRKCKQCNDPKINSEGICENCGAVCEEDANIVSEVTFGETSGGAAYVTGVSVAHGEAGPRMDMQNGKRRVAGNGGGKTRHQTLQMAALSIQSICFKLRGAVPASVQDTANFQFGKVQCVGWVRGRGIERVAAACLYYAIRKSDFTGVMLIDIADAINADVFVLGGTFKALLIEIHGVDDGTGHIPPRKVIRNCPFEPLYPEDIIKNFAARLKFDLRTEQVQMDAVRILQRMDRDWIVSGRKPAGICGAALVMAARMNNFRRSPTEVAYLAKIGKTTVDQRLDEFKRVSSAQMTVADFRDKEFIKDAHDPPAFYRQTKEYQEEQQRKKAEKAEKAERAAARKRKRRTGDGEDVDGESDDENEAEAAHTNKQQRTDADGFVIPPLPNNARSPPSSAHPGGEEVTAADVSEAVPLDDEDQELALASKYGDVPVPNAKEIRKNRMQGSSLRKPNCDEEEKLTPEEEEAMETILQQINDTESQLYVAASQVAGVQRQALMAALASTRPINYRDDGQIDAPDVHEDEFADDPEVVNCLLTESERLIKEKLWLNENKQWLREQQEKEYKARTAPPKKNRRKNPRKPRLGEGQTSPASSAAEATVKLTKRVGLSRKFNYDAAAIAAKLFSSGRRGPGSVMGSEATSAQTSRAGSMVDDSDDDEAAEESGDEGVVDDDDDDDAVEDYDEQVHNEDDGEEFGGGYDGDY